MSLPVYNKEAVSELFERGFAENSSGCIRECECGRVTFNPSGGWTWEKGELEELFAKQDADPDKYRSVNHSVGSMTIDDKEYVLGCPCNAGRQTEDFIIKHARQVAKYLNARAEALERHARTTRVAGVKP